MSEPLFFGLPLSTAFFYFVIYSALGWCQETAYCSILEKRFVPRGFLYGPICPIYGVGVLMMICWFKPLMGRPVLFYLTATVCMSAWEYLVGWFLETTTHIKYWDYSMYRFNLQGRICLWVCLTWGALSFIVLYAVHPHVEAFFARFAGVWLYFVDGIFLGALLFDSAATVVQLVRTSQLLGKLQQAGDELRLQISLGRAEFSDKLANLSDHLEDILPDPLDDKARAARLRYEELMYSAESVSRRFRENYRTMRYRGKAAEALETVKRQGEKVRSAVRSVVYKDPEESKK